MKPIITRILNKLDYAIRSRMMQKRKESDAIRFGILGLGYMANVFSKAITLSSKGVVTAVASRSKAKSEAFAKRYNAEYSFGNYKEMLEGNPAKIDIVYIATPVLCHYENIKMALECGCNVLCEKPICCNSAELQELISLARGKGLLLIEGMWSLCLPTFAKADEWLKSGSIGKLTKIEADLSKKEKLREGDVRFENNKAAGVMMDYGVYPIAFVSYYLGGNIRIENFTVKNNEKSGYDEDWKIDLSDGFVTANITTSFCYDGSRTAKLIGDKGSIEWSRPFNRTNTITLKDLNGIIIETASYRYISEGFEYQIEEVYRKLRNKQMKKCLTLDDVEKRFKLIDDLK